MNLLIIGSGKGSWEMRGQQLGAALGARVTSTPSEADRRWADVVVLVKRAGLQWCQWVRQAGKPLVWDALDCWSQPAENRCHEAQARRLLMLQIATIQPTLTIGATEAMAEAAHGVYLPHHSWAGLVPTPARETVTTVAYQGNPQYLGAWHGALRRACADRGWTFTVNPVDVSGADILVAFRDGPWDGWMCRQWKSGVKAVNAIAAGRPLMTQPSAAVDELPVIGSLIEAPSDLGDAFEEWADYAARDAVVRFCRGAAPSFAVDAVADQYRHLLGDIADRRAA